MTEKLKLLANELEELARRKRENRIAYYEPYGKQREFHALGASHRERLFLAGNQLGKTFAGGAELAMHLTGRYPEWWTGRRFSMPVRAWAAGVTGESTRDNPQRILMGLPGQYGTGSIPKEAIHSTQTGRGLPDALDTVYVNHVSGGISQLSFKAYEKGREKWQGETLDVVWLDEEPPPDIYTEALARITARQGIIYLTATPLLGMSEVVRKFLQEPSDDRASVRMELSEALHIPEAMRESIIAGYPEHEREARVKGIPMLGSGRIFPVAESAIACEPFPVPDWWPKIGGLDFGWTHPTAAVCIAWDRDRDCVYVTAAYRVKEATPVLHAAALRAWGRIPFAWPHDGNNETAAGEALSRQYLAQGLAMLPDAARYEDARGNSVEAGLMDMLGRMQTARLKVFRHLESWFEEFRLYHRKDGKVVKIGDDLMSATRYAVMSLRYARNLEEDRGPVQTHYGTYDPLYHGTEPRRDRHNYADWSPF